MASGDGKPAEAQEPIFSFSDFIAFDGSDSEKQDSSASSPGDSITCATASSKVVIFGRSSGTLQVLDLAGNILRTYPSRHKSGVICVSLGGRADVIASCGGSKDPRIIVSVVFPEGVGRSLAAVRGFSFRVKDGGACVVAVDPEYGRPRWGERVAYGTEGGKVVLYTRGWLGGSEEVLSKGEGKVEDMAWEGSLLAWACDNGVRVYDTRLGNGVCLIEQPSLPKSPGSQAGDRAKNEESEKLPQNANHESHLSSLRQNISEAVNSESSEEAPGEETVQSEEFGTPMEVNSGSSGESLGDANTASNAIMRETLDSKTRDRSLEMEENERFDDLGDKPSGEQMVSDSTKTSDEVGVSSNEEVNPQSESLETAGPMTLPNQKNQPPFTNGHSQAAEYASEHDNDNYEKKENAMKEDNLTRGLKNEAKSQVEKIGAGEAQIDNSFWVDPGFAKNIPYRCRIQWFFPEGGGVSEYGERTLTLIITYPWACKVVNIGPHQSTSESSQRPRDIFVDRVFDMNNLVASKEELPRDFLDFVASFPTSVDTDALIAVTLALDEGYSFPMLHLVTSQSSLSSKLSYEVSKDLTVVKVPGSPPIILLTSVHMPRSPMQDAEDGSTVNRNIVAVRPLSLTERLENLMLKGHYRDALALALKVPPVSWRASKLTLAGVGDSYLQSLLDAKSYEALVKDIFHTISETSPVTALVSEEQSLKERRERWEKWVDAFVACNKAHLVTKVVPVAQPRLSSDRYTELLTIVAASDSEVVEEFPSLFQRFPPNTVNTPKVIDQVERRIDRVKNESSETSGKLLRALRNGLVAIYEREKDDKKVLQILLDMRSLKVFDLLFAKSTLYDDVLQDSAMLRALFLVSPSRTASQLAHSSLSWSMQDIVKRIEKLDRRKWVFDYLHALFRMDPTTLSPYDDKYIELCIEFGSTTAVGTVIRGTHSYNVERALELMAGRRDLVGERVYLMKAIGDFDGALEIMMKEGGGVKQAVDFIEGEGGGDDALWRKLYEYVEKNSKALGELLERAGSGGVDSIRLVKMLKADTKIDGLRKKLLGAVQDARLERELREACNSALETDAYHLIQQLERGMMRPL
eukprot:Plantae.Rhodophyta-Hildenbrandia_rubra.ctg3009.p1 GENE.Plantae.Rhodophyta-Hildenbrandia_rubra.ctg3009~~Plantae.Rhodophyta-Hildenbrandia_rubra.ctg3009.p1  ORF type:complete len:1089 (+),score=206.69 Plantae.Rhodophyta-Hildenbrandia_rubra.ctg3009:1563-4829(+)